MAEKHLPRALLYDMHNSQEHLIERGSKSLLGTYKRFPLIFSHGSGSYLFDIRGRKFLDFGSGIAVTSLGHANPEITEALTEQASRLNHCSNLYYSLPQIELAEKLISLIAPGKIFFCNSGAEANECLIKLARAFGQKTSRYEIITMKNSFHGRTMAGISATGQDKVKQGFAPLLEGFTHVPFNSIEAVKEAYNERTAAILLEVIQGESGIFPADPDYLIALRKFCNEKNILLLLDEVQCGFFRTASFQSYQEILSSHKESFLPDGIAMAKSLGGGVPIGATWISDSHTDNLGAGSHGTTYGGNPLVCRTALKIIEIIEREQLTNNIREMGNYLRSSLHTVQEKFPHLIAQTRGLGLIQGCALHPFTVPDPYSTLSPSSYLTLLAMEKGLLLVPAGDLVVRFLPQYQVNKNEIDEGIALFTQALTQITP